MALGGCAVVVPVEVAPNATEPVCASVVLAMPDSLGDGLPQRDTTAQATTAWGDPAASVVLRCGVDQPPEYSPVSELQTVNGVDWLAVEADGGFVFYATGREAWVEVRVPTAYAPEVNPLVDLAAAVSGSLPLVD